MAPFEAFIRSYKAHAAGADHDLLIIMKGFRASHELNEYQRVLDGLSYTSLRVSDRGFDIAPYSAAAKRFDYRYFCFLNSFSTVLEQDWLAKMYGYVRCEKVGVVGATGSYQSAYSSYSRILDAQPTTGRLALERMVRNGKRRWELSRIRSYFDPFPNYHVRTNAFLISRSVMLKLQVNALRTKMDVLRFESGKRGLTRQICDMGLDPLVVGRDGRAYMKEAWYESHTFRSGDQRNLLVADNRTNEYMHADSDTQRFLSEITWGDKRAYS